MNKLKTKDFFLIKIDSISDDIDFKLKLFNEGNYDKNELRTIIKNTGLELKVTNSSFDPMVVTNLHFGLLKENRLFKTFSSSSIDRIFPTSLYSGGEIIFYFYGWEIKEILQNEENEDGVFILSSDSDKRHYQSSRFSGEELEKKLIYLEDDEAANWGGKKYNSLDIETLI